MGNEWNVGGARVVISATAAEAGVAAAREAAAAIDSAVIGAGRARVVFGSAPSQEGMLHSLVHDHRVDWSRVEAMHMDEYVGLDADDSRSFSSWLAARLPVDLLTSFARIDPAADAEGEAQRYEALLRAAPIDVTCLGFGVNGHIAFNEPGSDLDDRRWVRVVDLASASRQQQVDEGLFDTLDDVPRTAVTLTVPALLSATTTVATVVGSHKESAVTAALTGPVGPRCPASAIRRHPSSSVHLDAAAAAGLGAV